MCLPDKDLTFVITSDNQGASGAQLAVLGGFFDLVASHMEEEPLPEDEKAVQVLADVTKDLKLRAIKGAADSPLREEISGKTYICEPNHLGMEKFTFVFHGTDSGEFRYTNAQGDKVIPFGVNKNVFGKFPQLGYAGDYGNVLTNDGSMYDDAVSLCWAQDNKILLKVQIIDRYFGQLSGVFAFRGEYASCHFEKAAEAFLEEYQGDFVAKAEDKH